MGNIGVKSGIWGVYGVEMGFGVKKGFWSEKGVLEGWKGWEWVGGSGGEYPRLHYKFLCRLVDELRLR